MEQLSFNMLGKEPEDSESEEDDEKEKQAEQINVAEKDGWEGLRISMIKFTKVTKWNH